MRRIITVIISNGCEGAGEVLKCLRKINDEGEGEGEILF